jgi:hypothetical protein
MADGGWRMADAKSESEVWMHDYDYACTIVGSDSESGRGQSPVNVVCVCDGQLSCRVVVRWKERKSRYQRTTVVKGQRGGEGLLKERMDGTRKARDPPPPDWPSCANWLMLVCKFLNLKQRQTRCDG